MRGILQSDFFNRIPNLRRDSKEIIKSEFVILLLNLMGKVDDKDILMASKIFDKLDRECDGTYELPGILYVCIFVKAQVKQDTRFLIMARDRDTTHN